MKNKSSLFFKLIKKIFFTYLVIVSMFMIFRLLMLLIYGSLSELSNYKLDVVNALYVGVKFDTSVATYGMIPVLLYAIFFSIFSVDNNKKSYSYFSKIATWYFVFISMLFLIISLIDYFFYSYFQTHISPLIYGLKNDKTSAVLVSMWTDYPVIKVIIIIFIALYGFIKIYKKIFLKLPSKQISFKKLNIVVIVLILGFYFLGMRGSVGMFPLRLDNTSISTNSFVNELVLNGPFALKIANGLKEESLEVHLDNGKILENYGFKSKKEALSLYLDKEVSNQTVKELLTVTTEKNNFLNENPPNVVFVLVESFSNHYLDLHSNELNLLGELEKELPYCYIFRNMLSAENLTVNTLEGILLGTSKGPISQSPYTNITFNSSVANPFKNNDYQTSYLTAGQLGWRSTGALIKNQNFDVLQGFSFFKEKYIDPETFIWGVHDQYLYRHMYDVLIKAQKPQFIFTLTISNHTPFNLPKSFEKPNLKISDSIKKHLIVKEDLALKNFASYHYAANELGKFINKIRTSPLGKNTIIVATGDHNVRGIFNYDINEFFLKRNVPVIMYIPEKYKPPFVDLNRFGAHKDIFPTIFNLALSNATYIKTGNDLFSKTKNYFFAENNHTTAGNKNGVVAIYNKKAGYYRWKDTLNFKGLIQTTIGKNPKLGILKRKMDAHGAVMMLNFQDDVISKTK